MKNNPMFLVVNIQKWYKALHFQRLLSDKFPEVPSLTYFPRSCVVPPKQPSILPKDQPETPVLQLGFPSS
jgi:hypothetical protein